MPKNKLKNRKISGMGKERRKYLNKTHMVLFSTVPITSYAKLTGRNKYLFRRTMTSHWELYLGEMWERSGATQDLFQPILNSFTFFVLRSSTTGFFLARHFWKNNSTRPYFQRAEPSVLQAVILYFGVLSCTSFSNTETQTTNGMIGISMYLSIFYYSCHFRGLQIINSLYLLICFPSKIFPFHLKPLFVLQAADQTHQGCRAALKKP